VTRAIDAALLAERLAAPASAAHQGIGVQLDTPVALLGLPWGDSPEHSTEEPGIVDAPR
jgi:hypothetical protein